MTEITEEKTGLGQQIKTHWKVLVAVFVIVAFTGAVLLARQQAFQAKKLVVLIAGFEGSEEAVILQNEIAEHLSTAFAKDEGVEILTANQVITAAQGSERARRMGQRRQADVVLWGFENLDENPNVSIYVENMEPEQNHILKTNLKLDVEPVFLEMETFTLEQDTGEGKKSLLAFLTGFVEYKKGDYEAAADEFYIALISSPYDLTSWKNAFEVYFYYSRASFLIRDYWEAKAQIDRAVRLDPQNAMAYSNRGSVFYMIGGDWKLAIEDYNRALELSSESPEVYYNRGIVFNYIVNRQQAIEDFSRAIELMPRFKAAYYYRGFICAEIEEFEQALQDYTQVVKLNPGEADVYVTRGVLYGALGDYGQAIEDYTKALDIARDNVMAYYNRGVTFFDLEEYEKALEDYSQAVAIDSEFASAYRNRGSTYLRLGEYQKAIDDYTQVIEKHPKHADEGVYRDRGLAYARMGKFEVAIENYSRSIEINHEFVNAYNDRGVAYENLGDYEKAIDDYTTAIKIDPHHIFANKNRGDVYRELGEYEKAIDDYTTVIVIDPENNYAYYYRGITYQEMGEDDKAEADFAIYGELIAE